MFMAASSSWQKHLFLRSFCPVLGCYRVCNHLTGQDRWTQYWNNITGPELLPFVRVAAAGRILIQQVSIKLKRLQV